MGAGPEGANEKAPLNTSVPWDINKEIVALINYHKIRLCAKFQPYVNIKKVYFAVWGIHPGAHIFVLALQL